MVGVGGIGEGVRVGTAEGVTATVGGIGEGERVGATEEVAVMEGVAFVGEQAATTANKSSKPAQINTLLWDMFTHPPLLMM